MTSELKTEQVIVEGVEDAGIIASVLLDRSAWFEVTPLPHGLYEVRFKAGEQHKNAIAALNLTLWGTA